MLHSLARGHERRHGECGRVDDREDPSSRHGRAIDRSELRRARDVTPQQVTHRVHAERKSNGGRVFLADTSGQAGVDPDLEH